MTRATGLIAAVALLLAACGGTGGGDGKVVLLTHDSFGASPEVLAEFTEATGIEVTVLLSGDAGAMVNQAILTKDNPLADVLYGVDTTFLSRALDAGIFEPYEAAGLERVAAGLRLEGENRVTPIDFGDVCLNYDRAAFGAGVPPPAALEDLTRPAYRSMTVVPDPATSSPGLAFLLATIAHFGEDATYSWRDYWADLRDNDVRVVAGWEEAYYGAFSGATSEGDRPIVVSYASSPPAEVIFAEEPVIEAPTSAVAQSCFRQVEYAGIISGTESRAEAELLVDFLLSDAFQADVPLQMFVFPAVAGTPLPIEFVDYAVVPVAPLTLDPAAIGERVDEWIRAWADIVLR